MKIAIIGGGPVGLTAAIKLIYEKNNKINDIYDITIFEKRKKYIREQFLIFGGTKGNLLSNYPFDLSRKIQKHVQCYLENPVFDMKGLCFEDMNDIKDYREISKSIQISTLEKILNKYIKEKCKSNIKIIYKEFNQKDVKNYDIIIGADGQKSYVREKIMKLKWNDMKDYETYILHIKYTDRSNKEYRISKNLLPQKVKDSYELSLKRADIEYDQCNSLFEQDRFRLIRSNTNKTQFMLQIRKSVYNKIKNMKVFDELPTKIKNAVLINSYLLGSKPINLAKTKINIYNSKIGHSTEYCFIKNSKLFALIGDSAMTTHVFTGEGLNVNFNNLVITINKFYKLGENHKDINSIIRRYNILMKFKFKNSIKYSAMSRYIPHNLLDKICSKIKLMDILELKDHFVFNHYEDYEDIVENMEKKYKDITEKEIRNELCYVFRDIVLKNFTYKLKFG